MIFFQLKRSYSSVFVKKETVHLPLWFSPESRRLSSDAIRGTYFSIPSLGAQFKLLEKNFVKKE